MGFLVLACLASCTYEQDYRENENPSHYVVLFSDLFSCFDVHSCLLCSLSIFDDKVDVFDTFGDCFVFLGRVSDVMAVLVELSVTDVFG